MHRAIFSICSNLLFVVGSTVEAFAILLVRRGITISTRCHRNNARKYIVEGAPAKYKCPFWVAPVLNTNIPTTGVETRKQPKLKWIELFCFQKYIKTCTVLKAFASYIFSILLFDFNINISIQYSLWFNIDIGVQFSDVKLDRMCYIN